ncbi:hypothetical protein Lepto7376_3540 [[Leptolyngbya] sp. PCC 7376]|uniref:DUF928 domain-containing protein n=1 Tax=[Leptolyngbya] sp. PCC 7376 TaxID=111781 RepID=UPI00029F47CC|nr:DUF928 domain-containing protein [[Leptolyngbya] sp. PCC 7376]AFY39737.1 hypothetical protein Lepto7376_3540 [[Leptolyngbya] sp. PCC 7376]
MSFLNGNKKILNFGTCASLSLALTVATGTSTVFSQTPANSEITDSTTLMSKAFNPPNEGEPAQTVGGASRGLCSGGDLASVSFKQTSSALTAQLPEGMAKQVFFSLRDASNNTLYQGFVPVNNNQALISGDVLGDLDAANGDYTWSMAIICGRALRPDSPVFRGNL